MALILAKETLLQSCFTAGFTLKFRLVSAIRRSALISTYHQKLIFIQNFGSSEVGALCFMKFQIPVCRCVSTSTHHKQLSWESSSSVVLLRNLEIALKGCQLDEAWESFNDFKRLYGLPKDDNLMLMLVSQFSYSSDCNWIQKACDLVLQNWKQKPILLQPDVLTKLSLTLARSQMPIPTSRILRLMLHIKRLPQMKILQLVILHMVKTQIGTCLASNILVQICDCFVQHAATRNDLAKLMKPNTVIFNLVLDACVRFKLSFKGHQLIELMPQTGVVADAHTIVLISQIHDRNGQRDNLKKFKIHIDQVSHSLICHYHKFYNSLLSLHFKFDDFESAANLVLEMGRFGESHSTQKHGRDLQRSCLVPIGSHNLKDGLKIQILPELLQKDSILSLELEPEFVGYKNGKLFVSNKTLAKLIVEFRRLGRTSELSKLLTQVQQESISEKGSNLNFSVIKACICLGWLETAHDILDDIDAAGYSVGSAAYFSLLKAYEQKMPREAEALKKQMRKMGLLTNVTEDKVINGTNLNDEIDLFESLVQEMNEKNTISRSIFQLNSSIYFFCKANMIEDALKAYKRMQQMGIQPTEQTCTILASGYASLQMYRSITILWGDIKRNMERTDLGLSRDFYEFLLLCFLRGGYFERVMEIAGHIEEQKMFPDKWMYKREFLKVHKNLYRNLQSSEAITEAQRKRLEYVRAFKKWVGDG